MGVVYKITPEIMDFILQHKKEKPDLSCRKIADIVNQTFAIAISKSSINKILKASALSGPIGRHGVSSSGFKIPESKKKQLFGSLASSKRADSPHRAQEADKDVDAPLEPLMPEGLLIDGAGTWFLKAAQWEAAEGPILGPILKEHLKAEGLTDVIAAGEILLFMECFGVSHFNEIDQYEKQGLWEVSDVSKAVDRASLEKIVNDIEDLHALALRLSIELPQIFAEMHLIELELEDGSLIRTDVNLWNFYQNEDNNPFAAAPVNKALSILMDSVINNVQSALILFASDRQELGPMFFNWVAAMENRAGKRIRKASLRDRGGREVVCFHTILPRKRTFAAGVWPWHNIFQRIIQEDHIEKVDSVYLKDIERKLYFREVAYPLQNPEIFQEKALLRAVLLRETMEGAPFLALLTNAAKTVSADHVIAAFFQKWPHLPTGESVSELKKRSRPTNPEAALSLTDIYQEFFDKEYLSNSPDFLKIVRQVLRMLSLYVQRHYFLGRLSEEDTTHLMPIIYGMDGYLKKDKKLVKVTFAPSPDDPYTGELKKAVQKVNERMILDPFGRRLFMKVLPRASFS